MNWYQRTVERFMHWLAGPTQAGCEYSNLDKMDGLRCNDGCDACKRENDTEDSEDAYPFW